MGSYASHFDRCPPAGAPTVSLAGDAGPLIHAVIAWCEAEFGAAYSLTQWRGAAQRTGEHPGGFTAWYGEGKLTPGVQACPGYAAGTSALRDCPSHDPAYRWTFTAWDETGQRWWTCRSRSYGPRGGPPRARGWSCPVHRRRYPGPRWR